METQDIFIAHPKTPEQVDALKAFMNALNIRFEMSTTDHSNPEFVQKVLESRLEAKEGKITRIKKENLKEYLSL